MAFAEEGQHRHQHDGLRFTDNAVSTSKYTLLSFIPKSLFEQFRRLANVYFLLIIILLMLGTYTTLFQAPLTPYTTLFPLLVVLAVTMGKEGIEDIKRHWADVETNTSAAEVLSLEKPGEFEQVQRQQIRVGRCVGGAHSRWSGCCRSFEAWAPTEDPHPHPFSSFPRSIVRVLDKQEVPADMVLLTSSENGGNCYIETSNIDGETNLKIKQAAQSAADGAGPIWNNQGPEALFGYVRGRVLVLVSGVATGRA